MARVRVHRHVNPLAPYYTQPVSPVDFSTTFANPKLPLHLDIGCARGRFLQKMALVNLAQNFLGLEIREPLVDEANRLKGEEGLKNLYYKFCNATIFLDEVLSGMPDEILKTVTIQFPDPWFKKKHAKRRMVNEEMVEWIRQHLTDDGMVFVQTDVQFLAEEMFDLFDRNKGFKRTDIELNPFPIKSEREISVENRGLPVYRKVFCKK